MDNEGTWSRDEMKARSLDFTQLSKKDATYASFLPPLTRFLEHQLTKSFAATAGWTTNSQNITSRERCYIKKHI